MPLKTSGLPVTSLNESSTSLHCLRTLKEEIRQIGERNSATAQTHTPPHDTGRGTAHQKLWILSQKIQFWRGPHHFFFEQIYAETIPAPHPQREALNVSFSFCFQNHQAEEFPLPHEKSLSPKVRAQKRLRCLKPHSWSQGIISEQASPSKSMLKSRTGHYMRKHRTHCATVGCYPL